MHTSSSWSATSLSFSSDSSSPASSPPSPPSFGLSNNSSKNNSYSALGEKQSDNMLAVSPLLAVPEQPQHKLKLVTMGLVDLYQRVNKNYHYNRDSNPKRILTKPSTPVYNDNHDNSDHDYLLVVHDIIGSEEGHQYLILDLMGQGTFGQVAKCQHLKTGQMVAVKVIKNKPAYFNQSMMEVKVLELLNRKYDSDDGHHILRMTDTFIFRHHLCLVCELLSINLYELIKMNNFRGLSTNLIKLFTAQILDALTIFNQAKLIHCDLKPENILLKSMNSTTLKVIDYGSACQEQRTVYSYIQSRFYRSPEVLLGMSYSSAIDMWSLGCICAELFLGLPVFPGSSEFNQITRIVEMLGNPPAHLIELGKNGRKYFRLVGNKNGQPNYAIKNLQEYNLEYRVDEKPSKRYFEALSLPQLVRQYPLRKQDSTGTKARAEMQQREIFIDFLQGLLRLNPLERWTAQQALLHPFITGEPFTAPFVPPSISDERLRAASSPLAPPVPGSAPFSPPKHATIQPERDSSTMDVSMPNHASSNATTLSSGLSASAFFPNVPASQSSVPPPAVSAGAITTARGFSPMESDFATTTKASTSMGNQTSTAAANVNNATSVSDALAANVVPAGNEAFPPNASVSPPPSVLMTAATNSQGKTKVLASSTVAVAIADAPSKLSSGGSLFAGQSSSSEGSSYAAAAAAFKPPAMSSTAASSVQTQPPLQPAMFVTRMLSRSKQPPSTLPTSTATSAATQPDAPVSPTLGTAKSSFWSSLGSIAKFGGVNSTSSSGNNVQSPMVVSEAESSTANGSNGNGSGSGAWFPSLSFESIWSGGASNSLNNHVGGGSSSSSSSNNNNGGGSASSSKRSSGVFSTAFSGTGPVTSANISGVGALPKTDPDVSFGGSSTTTASKRDSSGSGISVVAGAARSSLWSQPGPPLSQSKMSPPLQAFALAAAAAPAGSSKVGSNHKTSLGTDQSAVWDPFYDASEEDSPMTGRRYGLGSDSSGNTSGNNSKTTSPPLQQQQTPMAPPSSLSSGLFAPLHAGAAVNPATLAAAAVLSAPLQTASMGGSAKVWSSFNRPGATGNGSSSGSTTVPIMPPMASVLAQPPLSPPDTESLMMQN